jgi:hypothetical protein
MKVFPWGGRRKGWYTCHLAAFPRRARDIRDKTGKGFHDAKIEAKVSGGDEGAPPH